MMFTADRSSLLRGEAGTFVALGVVARRVGYGFHSPRHWHLPTSTADSSGTTARVTSAGVAAVVTVLCWVDDCYASQLRVVFVKIQPSLISTKYRNFIKNRNVVRIVKNEGNIDK